jgi:glycosyltransferase involved in cell wall biosynthesis
MKLGQDRVGRCLDLADSVAKVENRTTPKIPQNLIFSQLRHCNTQVRLVGEVNDEAKQKFLAGASALLFPIDWPEPFGLVMIEAMACGTRSDLARSPKLLMTA